MNKLLDLLNTYRGLRTLAAAQKVRAYERKHPMAAVLLNKLDADMLADAIHHANTPQD